MTSPANLEKVNGLMQRLSRAFSGPDRQTPGFDGRAAKPAVTALKKVGLSAVTYNGTDAELQDFVQRLEDEQNWLVWERMREWMLHLYYVGGEQRLTWHKGRRAYLPRPTMPWTVKSFYNVCAKAENYRVSRLTENKPSVSVQARTASRDDIEKAEYKEQLFWYLWDRLQLHQKIVRARRWGFKTGSGFLKVGWDPEAGPACPATRQVPRKRAIPVLDDLGQPVMDEMGQAQTEEIIDGVDEFYLDAKGEEVGPVEIEEADPITGDVKRTKAPIPQETEYYHEGEVYCEVVPPFELRWDRFTDALEDSWYIQHIRVRPMSQILADFPEKADELREANIAEDSDSFMRWTGLVSTSGTAESPGFSRANRRAGTTQADEDAFLQREYRQVETWIYPKNDLLRRLWGERGAVITTVGGVLVEKKPMREWATKACNFIQIPDTIEEGNHYGKPPMRDLVPLQDDINRSRSMQAERLAIITRLLLWAPNNHGMNVNILGHLPGMLLTTRSKDHKPEALDLGSNDPGIENFYNGSLNAFNDLGNTNEASSGKLPSAGLAAKAIYALQYADERSITETSNLQDLALKRLAEALDAVTRVEYTETRKIRLVGPDRSFLVEHEIGPDVLKVDVDYTFVPGSMLSRQKDAVKNEMFTLLEAGVISLAELRKHLPTVTPDMFRLSYDLQEAKARRLLSKMKRQSTPTPVTPEPWDDPQVFAGVLEEYMLSAEWEQFATSAQKGAVSQLWQAYKLQAQMAAAGQAMPGAPGAAAQAGQPAPGGVDGGTPAGGEPMQPGGVPGTAGAQSLEEEAVSEMEPAPAM